MAKNQSKIIELSKSHEALIKVDDKSQLELVVWVKSNYRKEQSHNLIIEVGEDAKVVAVIIAGGGHLTSLNTQITLNHPNSCAKLIGAGVALSGNHLAIETLQNHLAKNTTSQVEWRLVAADNASTRYNGLIEIAKGADGSDAYQKNRNLLLGSLAKAYSKPKLEIKANDVKCSHGSTSGMVDAEQLFYLTSRGLSKSEAEKLLVTGFFHDIEKILSDPKLINFAKQKLADLPPSPRATAGHGTPTAPSEGREKKGAS